MNNPIAKKKILFVITQSEFGGAQHYVWEIARSLNPAVYDVIVAAGPEGDDELGLLAQLQKIGVKTRHLKHLKRAINPVFDLLAFFELKKLVAAEKPDVLFLNSTKAGVLGSIATERKKTLISNGLSLTKKHGYQTEKRRSITPTSFPLPGEGEEKGGGIQEIPSSPKVIYRIGGWAFNEDIANWKKKLYLTLEKGTAKRKDLIIVNSEADRKIGIASGIAPPEKIITIYNGLDWQKIKFLARDEARLSLQTIIPSNIAKNQTADWWVSRKIIGSVANLYETKGLRYFVEAAALVRKSFPEALFFVIGEGRQRAELETLILKNRLRDNFFIFGNVPSARIFIKAFNIFVLPSVKEGMPWAILEAMAAEAPIAATAVGGIPEMIEHSKSGLLAPPKDPKALAEIIVYLLKNPVAGETLAKQAKQTLINKFSFSEMLQKTEAALNL